MPKPNVGVTVEAEMESVISGFMLIGCPTRAEAAKAYMDIAPSWFRKTPEGQYMEWIIGGKNELE